MLSTIRSRGSVAFPAFLGERHHMRAFFPEDGLPADLSRWQSTVYAMLDGVETNGPVYVTIDESVVRTGSSHRRGGLHLDGFWIPELSKAQGGYAVDPDRLSPELRALYEQYAGGRHTHIACHGTRGPGHRNEPDTPRHSEYPRHGTSGMNGFPAEGLILASNVSASRAFIGEWDGEIGEGGDLDHIDVSSMNELMLEANRVYAGNVTTLHESLPVSRDCARTLVRLNVPGWEPN